MIIVKIIGITLIALLGFGLILAYFLRKKAEKSTYEALLMEKIELKSRGFYEVYVKRVIDIFCGMLALTIFSPLYLLVAILVKMKLGSPVLFTQERPGLIGKDGREYIFKMYKFRTMTDEKDEEGNPLPDELRLTAFGKWLRATSLDELPEVFNILNGTMSVIGPRPQLVRDMTFMTKEQRQRHSAKPGLSGLAQVNGRNAITWEDKFRWDLQYIQKISLLEDIKIIFQTVFKAFVKKEGIQQENMATAEDLGDYLLRTKQMDEPTYQKKQLEAKAILRKEDGIERIDGLVSVIMPSYQTEAYIRDSITSVLNQTYPHWELLIVDDASKDNTLAVVEAFDDERIHFYRNEFNQGAAISRNKALALARGEWIAFLDSDDLWSPSKLEKQIHFMKENGYDFSYTYYEEMDELGNRTGRIIGGPSKVTRSGMHNYCWLGCLTVMYNAKKIGLIQIEDIKKNNDYAMWLKVSKKADAYCLEEILGQYRRGRVGSISSHSIYKMILWHYRLYRDAEKMGVLSSLIHTFRNLVFGFYKKIRYVKR